MANLNQSTISPKGFPLEPGGDASTNVSSYPTRKAAWHRTAVMMAAWVEIIVGASFVLVPNAQSQLVFAATLEGAGVHFARLAGIGLIGLGITSMPSNLAGTRHYAVPGLLLFNIAATIFFASVGLATTFRGVVLWPVVILHAVISIALALVLRHEGFRSGGAKYL